MPLRSFFAISTHAPLVARRHHVMMQGALVPIDGLRKMDRLLKDNQ
jgi:hypothetical protein